MTLNITMSIEMGMTTPIVILEVVSFDGGSVGSRGGGRILAVTRAENYESH